MAEGARFELADPLRGLRFSRPARSAAPSPLRQPILLLTQYLLKVDQSAPQSEVAPGLRIPCLLQLLAALALEHRRADGRDADDPPERDASIYRV